MIKLWINEKEQKFDDWEELIRKAIRFKAKVQMQSTNSCNMNQHYYRENQPVHASLDKASNSKGSKIKKSKPKAQKPKALNSNNSSYSNPKRNTETSNKARKEKKKHKRQKK